MRIGRFFGAALALCASAAFATAFATDNGGGGGYGGGGGHGGGNQGGDVNAYGGQAWSSSKSNSNANASAGITQIFKGGGGGPANALFGVAAIIGALNPPEGQKIIMRGGDQKVIVNFYGSGPPPIVQTGPMKGDEGVITTRRPPDPSDECNKRKGYKWEDATKDYDGGCVRKN